MHQSGIESQAASMWRCTFVSAYLIRRGVAWHWLAIRSTGMAWT